MVHDVMREQSAYFGGFAVNDAGLSLRQQDQQDKNQQQHKLQLPLLLPPT